MNNFGFGGTNVHVILEQAPPKRATNPDGKFTNGDFANGLHTNGTVANGTTDLHISSAAWTRASYADKTRYLFVFSAADETAAKAQVALLFRYVKQRSEIVYRSLYERLVFTLQRRTQLQWRSALIVTSQKELLERMDENQIRPVRTGRSPRLGFVFTGQGAQWYVCHNKINFFKESSPLYRYGMGQELRQLYPVFEKAILKADLMLKQAGCPWSLLGEINSESCFTQVA